MPISSMVIPGSTERLVYAAAAHGAQTVSYTVYNTAGAAAIAHGMAVSEP